MGVDFDVYCGTFMQLQAYPLYYSVLFQHSLSEPSLAEPASSA